MAVIFVDRAEGGSPAVAAEPFEVSITDAEITDLRERLRRTRSPEPEPVNDWSQGLPQAYAQELCRSWAEDYDFGFAKRLNVFPQYRDTIDGLGIHFVHVRSPEPDAFPLVLTGGRVRCSSSSRFWAR